MRMVCALGGNALLRRGERPDLEIQRGRVRDAARALAELAGMASLVVTHGNGPQVGLLALQAEAYRSVQAYPLDVLGAESEGMIGYLIEQEVHNCLPGREVATLLTQVEVDRADPAFGSPTKPIGPVYTEEEARRLAAERGYSVARDGAGMRRVVPSPEPLRILEEKTIRLLLDAGVVVVCAGGGGIPVVTDGVGAVHGVEAVIDKDASAALLAERVGADLLVLLTDVEGVYKDFGKPGATLVQRARPADLLGTPLDAGSMGPKVRAACRFVERTGKRAAIGALARALDVARGEAGTQVSAG